MNDSSYLLIVFQLWQLKLSSFNFLFNLETLKWNLFLSWKSQTFESSEPAKENFENYLQFSFIYFFEFFNKENIFICTLFCLLSGLVRIGKPNYSWDEIVRTLAVRELRNTFLSVHSEFSEFPSQKWLFPCGQCPAEVWICVRGCLVRLSDELNRFNWCRGASSCSSLNGAEWNWMDSMNFTGDELDEFIRWF